MTKQLKNEYGTIFTLFSVVENGETRYGIRAQEDNDIRAVLFEGITEEECLKVMDVFCENDVRPCHIKCVAEEILSECVVFVKI
ncbi:MAG: hypothetical protein Q8882_06175 [Bacillota bacterium]|nr:hypothetical protein [Bacillota bacterium]